MNVKKEGKNNYPYTYSLYDLYSGVAHLLTNTMCLIATSISQTVSFILYYGYTYLIYVILKLPRPKRINIPGVSGTPAKPKPPPVFDPKMLRRRQYAIDELIGSENNYQRYLNMLVDIYEPAYKDYLSYEERVLFFGSIHPLIELSKAATKTFESQIRRGAKEAEIGNLFLNKLNLVSNFVPFIADYLEITSRFTDLNSSDKKFMKLNEELEQANEPFSSLIVMPVQRMPKYVLLLKEISKATPDWHHDYQPLLDAMGKLKDEAQAADKKIAEATRRSKLHELEKSIRKCPPLVDDKRRIISRFEPTEDRTDLYLLSDMILITKEKTETLSRRVYTEIKKIVDLNKVVKAETAKNGVNLKTTGADYLIEITMRAKDLKEAIEKQLKEMKTN
ncbi:hypothetical protein TRFO_34523 [Tritrichomonas foetus]|uniref:DH domain-containing protein n=1 Tax=Tritrichomonas foetus TaxID=1144522 RepID=A0A1J4JKH4_9EUKA|nr:hypothetical protein TRFO_34523 [Tritrichomonas foetus]|eukprot:OHS99121.1 hypothetical protein TRFO_34523 [Tritrichomonas foetus]